MLILRLALRPFSRQIRPASGEVPNDSAAGGAGAGTGAKAPSQQQLRLAPFIRALPEAVSLSQPPNENKYVVTLSPSPLARARRISASSESTASSLTLGPLPIAELDLLSPRISPAWASPPSSPVLGSGQKRPVRRRLPFKNGFAENKGTVCATGAQDPAGDRGSVAAPAARDPAKDTDCVAAAAAQDPGGDKDTVEAAAARDPAKDTDCVAAAAAQDPGGDKDTVASAAAQYPAGVLLPVVESDSDEEVKRPSSFRRRRAISSSSSSAADISEGDESIDAGVEQEVATEDDAASNGSRGVQQVHRDDQSNLSVLSESDEDIMSTETLLLETSQAESVRSLSATKNDASVTPVPLSLPASSVARMPLVTCATTDTVIPPTNFSTGDEDIIFLFNSSSGESDLENTTKSTSAGKTVLKGSAKCSPGKKKERGIPVPASKVSKCTPNKKIQDVNDSILLVNIGSPSTCCEVEIGRMNSFSPMKPLTIPDSQNFSNQSFPVCKVLLERLDSGKTKRRKQYSCKVCSKKFANSLALLEHKTEFPHQNCA